MSTPSGTRISTTSRSVSVVLNPSPDRAASPRLLMPRGVSNFGDVSSGRRVDDAGRGYPAPPRPAAATRRRGPAARPRALPTRARPRSRGHGYAARGPLRPERGARQARPLPVALRVRFRRGHAVEVAHRVARHRLAPSRDVASGASRTHGSSEVGVNGAPTTASSARSSSAAIVGEGGMRAGGMSVGRPPRPLRRGTLKLSGSLPATQPVADERLRQGFRPGAAGHDAGRAVRDRPIAVAAAGTSPARPTVPARMTASGVRRVRRTA